MPTAARIFKASPAMVRRSIFLSHCVLLFTGSVLASVHQDSSAAKEKQAEGGPLGTWRGESKCVVKPSGCHDEDSVYRISGGQSQERVTLSGNKIVDSKEVNMGSGDCTYDAKTRFIDCPLPNGSSIHLELNGNVLEGKMTLRDGTLWRKIILRRDERK